MNSYSENSMYGQILTSNLEGIEFDKGTIPPEWVSSGQRETRSKLLGKTRDRLSFVMLWECGAVSFRWHYSNDETFIGLSGEAFMVDEKGEERRFAAGDVAFFPAGSDATWRIPDHFRKVAILKDHIWPPLALCLKAWNRLLQMIGLSRRSPF